MRVGLSRRGFLAGGLGLGMGAPLARAAQPVPLAVVSRILEVKGRAAKVFGLIGPDGQNGLALRLADRFHVRLINQTGADTLVHWHGLTPPNGADGVPSPSQPPLPPAQSLTYDFVNTRSGTHWMHSHVGLQEQQMLAAPLIVRETDQPLFDEQEHVVMLHDFTFREPLEILAELKAGGGGHAAHAMHGGAAMLNDVAFDAFLANDRSLEDPQVVAVEKGGQMRLRIINGAAASNMWIDLGSIEGELIAVDGNAVYPVRGSVFPLAIAQRADIRLRIPASGGAFPVLFRPEGLSARTGIVVATAGAAIGKLAEEGDLAPTVDLALERRLKPVASLRQEPVTRTEVVMLTGGAGYVWGLNGKPSMHDTLFTLRVGERIEVILHNTTGMAHPMHLHGHYFKIVGLGSRRIEGALRDTILVPPMETVTILFDADNPGTWAFHCHHLYHMNAGMMGMAAYTSAA